MRYYSEDHEWVELTGDKAIVGITEFAAEIIENVSYIELPEEGDDLLIGDRLGTIESEDEAFDIYAPLSGTVLEVNDALDDNPDVLRESPEGKGWICKFENIDSSEVIDMMDEEAYAKFIRKLGK